MWKRVFAPVAAVLVLWIALGGATTIYIHWLTRTQDQLFAENVASMRASAGMLAALWQMQTTANDASSADERQRAFSDAEKRFLQHFAAAEQSTSDETEEETVAAIASAFEQYRGAVQRRMERPVKSGKGSDDTILLAQQVAILCRDLVVWNERLLQEAVAHRQRLGTLIENARLAALVVGPLAGIVVGLLVARGLHRSMVDISVSLLDASGQLGRGLGQVRINPAQGLDDVQQQVQAITDRVRQVVGELDTARHEVEQKERLAAAGELAAGVAHELRNPLTSVKLLIQTIEQQLAEDRRLPVIKEEIARMEKTIEGLLDFARPQSTTRVRHDVRQTVSRAINLVEGLAHKRRVSIVEQLPDEPLLAEGDPEQLHQVFVNLLLNGIDAMDRGGELQVVARRDDVGPKCVVRVRDSGTGIPPEMLERVFEPFVTTKHRGTGLGLATSRRIILEHAGRIWATNRAEGGAEFIVELPASDDATHTGAFSQP